MSTSRSRRRAQDSAESRPAPRSRGQTLAEFALVVPLLLLLLLAVFDFGRAVYAYNAISNASRVGTRTAIVNQYIPDIKARAAQQATALGIDPSTGIDASFLEWDGSAACASIVVYPDACIAVVTVRYQFVPLTPGINFLIGSLALSATSQQPIESKCTTAGCPIP